MTAHHARDGRRPPAAAEPRILPLGGTRTGSVRDLVESLVDREASVHEAVRATVDVGDVPGLDVDAATLRELLEPLVAGAFAAAAGPLGDSDGPPLREVDVVVVATAAGIEIEIADTGADQPVAARIPPHIVDLAARCGVELTASGCATGGGAVTLRLPRRAARRQAA